jgi:hypothetical protein
MGEAFKAACTRIEGRPTRLYRGPGVESPAYPSPSWFLSAAPKEGVAAK